MTHPPVIFIGPSLPLAEATEILDADYRAPLRSGDLDAIGSNAIIGLIDGVLEPEQQLATVELRRALDRGNRIFGAASTGALFASRIRHNSLQGLGRVHQLLISLPEQAEDLIAVLYTVHSHVRLTEPLVNAILSYMDVCAEAGIVQTNLLPLVSRLCSIPLSERSQDRLRATLQNVFAEANEAIALGDLRDYKAEDARLLLHEIGMS